MSTANKLMAVLEKHVDNKLAAEMFPEVLLCFIGELDLLGDALMASVSESINKMVSEHNAYGTLQKVCAAMQVEPKLCSACNGSGEAMIDGEPGKKVSVATMGSPFCGECGGTGTLLVPLLARGTPQP